MANSRARQGQTEKHQNMRDTDTPGAEARYWLTPIGQRVIKQGVHVLNSTLELTHRQTS